MDWGDDGGAHTVIVIPVPALEPFVRARTEHYDAAWLSSDPHFTHAHITVLAPWLGGPSVTDFEVLESIATSTDAFAFEATTVAAFPDGTVHLPAEPAAPIAELMRQVSAAFPDCPPYAGAFGSVDELTPHITLDRLSAEVTVESTRALVDDFIPAGCEAQRLEVHRYRENDCRVLASFPLRPR